MISSSNHPLCLCMCVFWFWYWFLGLCMSSALFSISDTVIRTLTTHAYTLISLKSEMKFPLCFQWLYIREVLSTIQFHLIAFNWCTDLIIISHNSMFLFLSVYVLEVYECFASDFCFSNMGTNWISGWMDFEIEILLPEEFLVVLINDGQTANGHLTYTHT